jgi:3-oxoacyl-[acyl-carrier-protein] synthase II
MHGCGAGSRRPSTRSPLTSLTAIDRAGDGPSEARADPRRYSKASLIAVIAAREAWADAGLRPATSRAPACWSAAARAGSTSPSGSTANSSRARPRVTPYAIPVSIVGMISSEISIALELHGVSHVVSTGCTSSTDAIGYAASLVRAARRTSMLTGGADACVTPGMIFGFSRMRAVSTTYNDSPPRRRAPSTAGATASCWARAPGCSCSSARIARRARGAAIYATVDGYGSTCDAYHRVQMDPDGEQIVRAMRLAIDAAAGRWRTIGYVNYHGTSTVLNDAVESRCVREAVRRARLRVPGVLDQVDDRPSAGGQRRGRRVTTALALSRGFLPPTINLVDPDPACDMDFLPMRGAPPPEAALCNCLGFGSKNSALVLGARWWRDRCGTRGDGWQGCA